MLAVRDENVVNAAQAARQAQAKGQLGAKTPGAKFPKTPAKIPLNDENAMAGRTALKTKGTVNQPVRQQNLVTPSETHRAPLGNKTTNAKAKAGQQGVKDIVKEFEKSQQAKPTTVKQQSKQHKALTTDTLKVSVHNDNNNASEEPEVEYCPPRPKDLPYESDVFPEGGLTFEGLKRENLLRGYYNHVHNPVGQDGMRLHDRKHEKRMQKALKEHDEVIMRDIDAMDWSVSDVPGADRHAQKKSVPTSNSTVLQKQETGLRSAAKPPATVNSKRAASALSMGSGSTVRRKKAPTPTPGAAPARRPMSALLPSKKTTNLKPTAPKNAASADTAVGQAASRSTIGYTKGRTASSLLNGRPPSSAAGQENVRPRPASGVSTATVKQEKPAPTDVAEEESKQALQRLQFLSIFEEPEPEDDEFGSAPQFDDELDGEFELKLA